MSTINKKIWLCLLVSISSSYTLHVQAADFCADDNKENTAITATTAQLIDNNNGTITDPQTSLIWKKCSEGQTWSGAGSNNCDAATNASFFNWQEALQRAQDVNGSVGVVENFGVTDWRLPNVKELASIVELRCSNPPINNTVFPKTLVNFFWSSSLYAPSSDKAWIVNFSNGNDDASIKGSSHSVRLVRSGQ